MKKAKKIIGIMLLVIILIALIIGVLYYKTNALDFMKNPKNLFFTYMAQNSEGMPEYDYSEAVEKLKKDSYVSNSKISWKLETNIDAETQEYLEAFNDIALEIEGKRDTKNQRTESNIKVKSGNDEIISANLIGEKDELGLRLNEILDKYITIENRDLKALAEKLGIDGDNIPDKLDLNQMLNSEPFTEEQLKEIRNRYYNALYESIDEKNIERSKETIEIDGKEVKVNAYTLSLSEKETINIITNLLQTLRDDDVLLDYLVESVNTANMVQGTSATEQVKKADIKMVINSLIYSLRGQATYSNDKLEITVYERGGKTVQTKVSISDISIVLEKDKKGKEVNYNLIILEYGEKLAEINMKVTQDKDKSDVSVSANIENIEIELSMTVKKDLTYDKLYFKVNSDEVNMEFNVEDNIEFKDVQIEEINNKVILNDLTEEELYSLLLELQEGFIKFYTENQSKLDKILAPFMVM